MNEQIKKKLEATEMWFLRRIMRIPSTARVTDSGCLEIDYKSRKTHTRIRKRYTPLFGNLMRGEVLKNVMTTRKINNRRGRDRHREMMLDGERRWRGEYHRPN